jgi:DNA-binding transcriptional ArsR family regulator
MPVWMSRPALIDACAYVDSRVMDEITILQAEVLEVRRLASAIRATQPNVSQHLAVLRTAGVVEAERDGRVVRYRLADPDVLVACALMRTVIERRLSRLGDMAAHSTRLEQRSRPSTPRFVRHPALSNLPATR